MDKLAPWLKGIPRASIAALLAWALLMQGLAAAAPRGSLHHAVVSAEFDRCSSGGDNGHAPGRPAPCSCCLPCRSGSLGGLDGLPPLATGCVDRLFRIAVAAKIEQFSIDPASPFGWISSWSQRAPPLP
jgi:hypothetical protein